MIVGWLEDPAERIGYQGGAELDAEALRKASPHELVLMPPSQVEPGADAYVVNNCFYYTPEDIDRVDGPIVKVVNDSWRYGNPEVRTELLDRAALTVFRSPLHRHRFGYAVFSHYVLIPSQVDLARFRVASLGVEKQERAVWLAHVLSPERATGLRAAQRWANTRGIPLDAYGLGTQGGNVPYGRVHRLLAKYAWYAHAMGGGHYEPFGRATVEAWAAGCNLAVGEDTGATYWIRENPEALRRPADTFWAEFAGTLERCRSLTSPS